MGVLVNNVGVSYPFPKYFDELTDDEVQQYSTAVRYHTLTVKRNCCLYCLESARFLSETAVYRY